MVCSVVVCEILRSSLPHFFQNINCAEQTPKDIYQMKIFDTDVTQFPKLCQNKSHTNEGWCKMIFFFFFFLNLNFFIKKVFE
jgi:hypothetical protein